MNLLSICADVDLDNLVQYLNKMRNPNSSLNITDNHNWTPLHHLVGSDHYNGATDRVQCVQLLLQYPEVDVQARTYEGLTPFFLACTKPNIQIEVIEMLLQRDIDIVNIFNNEQEPPIFKAIEFGRLDIVEAILSTNKYPHEYQDIEGDNMYHLACINGQVHIVDYLLEHSPLDARVVNYDGYNALKIAEYRFNKTDEAHQKCFGDLFHRTLPDLFTISDVFNNLITSNAIPSWNNYVCTTLIHRYYETNNSCYNLIPKYLNIHFKDNQLPNYPLCLLFHDHIIGKVLFPNCIQPDCFYFEFTNLIIHVIENCGTEDDCFNTLTEILTTINLPAMDYIPLFVNWSSKFVDYHVELLEKICDILFYQNCSLNLAIIKMIIGFQMITESNRGPLIPIRVLTRYTSLFCVKPTTDLANSLDDFFHHILGTKSIHEEHTNIKVVASLQKQCRTVIREAVYSGSRENNYKFIVGLLNLQLPDLLKDYLRFKTEINNNNFSISYY